MNWFNRDLEARIDGLRERIHDMRSEMFQRDLNKARALNDATMAINDTINFRFEELYQYLGIERKLEGPKLQKKEKK